MDFIFSSEGIISILTLTFLEIILGVDNIVFISIISNKLRAKDQPRARIIGLLLAMVFRVLLLFGISFVLEMQHPIFSISSIPGVHGAFSGQSIILIIGGMFLLYKSVTEIHEKLEGDEDENSLKSKNTLYKVIVQIALLNIVFSFDSILTAIGITHNIPVMIIAVVLSIIVMIAFAGPVSKFVNDHPTIQILGLSFLILIGFMLVAEGAHLSHFSVAGQTVGAIPKGYLYFAIFFSLVVEFLNMKLRKPSKKVVDLHFSEEVDDIEL